MPPRRSSRSRASVEPEQSNLKRKRTAATPDPEPVAEKENLTKRSTRGRRVSATRTTRVASQGNASLNDVVEEDEESEAETRPPKKKRASVGDSDEEEEEAQEEESPPPRRASRAKAPTSRSRASKPPSVKAEPVDPPRRSTRGGSAVPPSKPPSKRSKAVKKVVESDSEEIDVDMEDAAAQDEEDAEEQQEDEEQEEEEDVKPAKRTSRGTKSRASSRQPSAKPPSRGRKGRSKPAPVEDEKDEQEEDEPKSESPPGPTSLGPVPEVDEDDEEQMPDPEKEHDKDMSPPASLNPKISSQIPPLAQAPPEIKEDEGPRKRLVINRLVLENFKSYAGRQTIGPFHKSFSAIVGPNGSGKSNTIDALLFVFGFRANKMRQSKLSELIHHSDKYNALGHCTVEVHFQEIIDVPNSDDFEVVPGSGLIVARTATRANTSTYTVNGKSVKQTDVIALLKRRGIDLDHNRFLILQGEVESIALMKPKGGENEEGLLEYLEDIIGSNQFKEPIEQAMTELEEINATRQDKFARLRRVEKEREALLEKKEEVNDYFRACNAVAKAKSTFYQFKIDKAFQSEKVASAKLAEAKEALDAEDQQNAENVAILANLETKHATRLNDYQEFKKEVEEAGKSFNKKRADKSKAEELRKGASSKLKKIKKSISEDNAKLTEAERLLEDSNLKAAKHREELQVEEKKMVVEEKELANITNSLKGKTQPFIDQMDAKQAELAPWTAKIEAKKAEIAVASNEKSVLEQKAADLQASCQEAETMVQDLKSDQDAKIKGLGELQQQRDQFQASKSGADGRLKAAKAKLEEAQSRANIARRSVNEARASQAEGRSQDMVQRVLNQFAREKNMTGFHGCLGSLGKIADDKYDVAVTTACSTLKQMVCDRVDEAQACLEQVRRANAGRVSVIVLEKLNVSPSQMAKKATPENVPRLFDLVTPKDPKFAKAFYKGMGETLVAQDMEQATRIAFAGGQRRRVVTLAGQMIEANGTMGGGGRPQSGGMSSKFTSDAVSPDVLRKLESDSNSADEGYDAAQRTVEQLERELAELGNKNYDMECDKLRMDIDSGKRRITDAEKRWKGLLAQNKPDAASQARIKKLESDIEKFERDLVKLQDQSSSIDAAIKKLHEKIMEIGGSRLQMQQHKVESCKFQINLLGSQITDADVAASKAQSDIARYSKSLADHQKALGPAEADLEEIQSNLEELDADLERMETTVEQAKVEEETRAAKVEKSKQKLDQVMEVVNAFKKQQAILQNAVNDKEKEVAAIEAEMQSWSRKHAELILEDEGEDEEEDDGDGEGSDRKPSEPPADEGEGEEEEEESPKPQEDPDKEPEDAPMGEAQKGKEGAVMYDEQGFRIWTGGELRQRTERQLKGHIEVAEDNLKAMAVPDVTIRAQFKEVEKEYQRRIADSAAANEQRDAKKAECEALRKQRSEMFMTGYNLISSKVREMYQMITLGGNATLELVDNLDPFSEGIVFSVMPPKKSWKNITNLSGGEKTLSSLALVFALHVYKPTPLYFMDEIDAALDFRNVSIVANYIKDRTKNAQFIIISLRNNMFELSNRLIGIYKTSNVTHSLSIANPAGQASVASQVE
ncbi:hypothetical protein CYLTODRAFT_394097 [Cylindrobasidium torrendii FP15055 ss-10]|uniref:Structural maintenance of chromosomes protein 4 n=1 Tax=Cylindrobasidium torrendii FP15055 ss-10 TaxID=1314674 RepID=A0A0D7BHT4_9AGAR|nr:hypothetical protein CYLTODRAFT_394097 [Cylindrobasidium torrendii FP15055 ss-10]